MEITFAPRGVLQIDDARIIWRNFKGAGSMFNNEGDRNFSLVIPNEELAEELKNDKNKFGAGWNVKTREPREEGEAPLYHLPVKVKYTERSTPRVFLISGDFREELTENTIGILDDISIAHIDLDIRPYDGEGRFGPHRTAYLQGMWVVQDVDRFQRRAAEGRSEE